MSWTDKVAGLKKMIGKERTDRSHLSVKGFCIHGEESCVRCASEDFEKAGFQPAVWQEMEPTDVRKVVMSLPDKTRELIRRHPTKAVLAGGYIRAIVTGEPTRDIDVFFATKSDAKRYIEDSDLSKIEERDFHYYGEEKGQEVQAIWRYPFNIPVDVPNAFDYTIVKAAVWFEDGKNPGFKSACHERFYRDLARKELVYICDREIEQNSGFPRLLKYVSYGYKIGPESLAEIITKLCLSLDPDKGFNGLKEDLQTYYKSLGSDKEWESHNKIYVKPRPRPVEYSSGS